MKQQIENAKNLLLSLPIQGAIAGSSMLDYFEDQDIDVFLYGKVAMEGALSMLAPISVNGKIIAPSQFGMTFLSAGEQEKYERFKNGNDLGLNKIGVVSIKLLYNTCVPVNLVLRKHTYTIYDVISNFDLDIISQGVDIYTGEFLSLRKTTGLDCTWNKYNPFFKEASAWNVKRFFRQFIRVIKYHNRGYNLDKVVAKYIELAQEFISKPDNFGTEKSKAFKDATVKEFEFAITILQDWLDYHIIEDSELQDLILLSQNSGGVQVKNLETK